MDSQPTMPGLESFLPQGVPKPITLNDRVQMLERKVIQIEAELILIEASRR